MHLTLLQRASYVRCAGVTLPIKRHTTQNAYLYMSSRIALSVVITDSTVLGGDLIREGDQSGRGFGDDNDARRNKDIFEL